MTNKGKLTPQDFIRGTSGTLLDTRWYSGIINYFKAFKTLKNNNTMTTHEKAFKRAQYLLGKPFDSISDAMKAQCEEAGLTVTVRCGLKAFNFGANLDEHSDSSVKLGTTLKEGLIDAVTIYFTED